MSKKLFLHNTLSSSKEEFIPINKEHVKIYACGPTVYNYAHIGNARMAVINDLLVRFLRNIFQRLLMFQILQTLMIRLLKHHKIKTFLLMN